MYTIIIRFYEELNDFLQHSKKKRDIEFSFKGRRSVKDLVESFGVPHVEVDLILVNGDSVDFSYIVQDSDRISVYPVFESVSIDNVTRLRPKSLRDLKFVLDVHLGKLVKRMRLLGFDVDYDKSRDDEELAMISENENRVLLSRDRQLMMRKNVSRGLYIRSTDPEKQIIELLERLDLWRLCSPFTRCVECNNFIEMLEFEGDDFNAVKDQIPEGVLVWCKEYFICQGCRRIYWKGSHYDKMIKIVEKIIER